MPAYFEEGFMVREPAWHGLGTVLDDYPGREKAMELAGHDFDIEERRVYVGRPLDEETGADFGSAEAGGWKALVRKGGEHDGQILHVAKTSYGVIQNSAAWDIVDAIVGLPEVKYETGITLKGGASCSVLAWLDEPVNIPGDDSPYLPYVNVAWHHDGSGAVTARATSIRVVCANTQGMAELEGRRLGTDFTFRHTRNALDRIEEAKLALRGIRAGHEEFLEHARELAKQKVTKKKRELFLTQFIPMPPEALVSDRVVSNIEDARAAVRSILDGPTVPEGHRFTAYGLHLAGVEYLDHVRRSNNLETKFRRCILRPEPMKHKLNKLIKEVVAA